MKISILFPCDYFDKKIVDEAYEDEYKAIKKREEFNIILYDYDEFFQDEIINTYPKDIEPSSIVIYRGWMLKPNQYKQLYENLKSKGVILINNPIEYNNLHLFPSVYNKIQEFTPKTVWFENHLKIDWDVINKTFSRFLIKDYVKSLKNTKFPIYFKTPVDGEIMDENINEFIKLRNNLLTGGIVIKEFVNLKKYHEKFNE